MGLKIKAKFESKCEKCDKTWKEQEEIYWDKEKRTATCSDLECYKSKGGSPIEFPSGGKGFSAFKFPITKASEIHNLALGLTDAVIAHLKSNDENNKIEMSDWVMMYTSHFKTLSQSYKGE